MKFEVADGGKDSRESIQHVNIKENSDPALILEEILDVDVSKFLCDNFEKGAVNEAVKSEKVVNRVNIVKMKYVNFLGIDIILGTAATSKNLMLHVLFPKILLVELDFDVFKCHDKSSLVH